MSTPTRFRSSYAAALAAFTLILGTQWSGCGGDDGGGTVTRISGDVATVGNASARSRPQPQSLYAQLGSWLVPGDAGAQACTADHVLYCLISRNAAGAVIGGCERVDPDSCSFDRTIPLGGADSVDVSFVDDVNRNGNPDPGEPIAALSNPLGRVCNGSVLALASVAIDFAPRVATAASVQRLVDTCDSRPTPTATATRRRPQATATPTLVPTHGPAPVPTRTPIPETICGDGIDNEGDGLIDCQDPDCESHACSDGNGCTTGETCTGGLCVGTLVNCDDGNACTTDVCEVDGSESFLCVNSPNSCDVGECANTGTPCVTDADCGC